MDMIVIVDLTYLHGIGLMTDDQGITAIPEGDHIIEHFPVTCFNHHSIVAQIRIKFELIRPGISKDFHHSLRFETRLICFQRLLFGECWRWFAPSLS